MEENNNLSYFFLGLGVGVAVGILFAPKAGPETRELIRHKADEGKEYLKRQGESLKGGANDLMERGKTVLNRQKDQLHQAMEAGKQAYREAVTSPERNVTNEGY